MLLQSYDFLYLSQHHAAISRWAAGPVGQHRLRKELIRRMSAGAPRNHVSAADHSTGKKFGKTEEGAYTWTRAAPVPTRCTNTGCKRRMTTRFAT